MDYKGDRVWMMHGDCLERMKEIPSGSVDMVLADPPYGTTACKWDSIIPLEPMWEQLKRVIKPNGAIVMTASQPFTSILVCSNLKMFKYDWAWQKSRPTGVLNAKKQPLRDKEDVLVFYLKQPTYNPQGITACNKMSDKGVHSNKNSECYGNIKGGQGTYNQTTTGYPRQVLQIASEGKTVHPTQKPVALMEYLIKTYTNEGEIVMDFTCGSGTTGVACANTGRKFIGIELDADFFQVSLSRVANG